MSTETVTPAPATLSIDPLAVLINAINAANEVGRKIQAANSDKSEAVKAVIETSDDEKIVKFREARAKVQAQIDEYMARLNQATENITQHAEKLIPGVDPNFDKEAATKDFLAKRQAAYKTRTALESFVPKDQLDEILKARGVAEIVSLKGVKGKSLTSGATGVRRPRISAATMDGNAVTNKDGKVDFTTLAKAAKAEAEDLKKAAFAAAGTEDLNSLPAGNVVEFSHGEHKFTVTISDVKPGRKPGEKKTEEPAK